MSYIVRDGAIETERLILRAPVPGDAGGLASIFSDPDVMRAYVLGRPFSDEEIDRMLPSIREHYAAHGFGAQTMCLKPAGTLVGLTGLVRVPAFADVQLGWVVAKEFWHRGFAFESGAALLRYAFSSLGLPRVEATTRSDNAAAIATIERLGMLPREPFRQGDIRFLRYCAEAPATRAPNRRASN